MVRKFSSRSAVLGLLGLSLLALAVTGLPIYSRLSYLWGLLLLGSWIWSVLALRGIQVQRETRIQRAHHVNIPGNNGADDRPQQRVPAYAGRRQHTRQPGKLRRWSPGWIQKWSTQTPQSRAVGIRIRL